MYIYSSRTYPEYTYLESNGLGLSYCHEKKKSQELLDIHKLEF